MTRFTGSPLPYEIVRAVQEDDPAAIEAILARGGSLSWKSDARLGPLDFGSGSRAHRDDLLDVAYEFDARKSAAALLAHGMRLRACSKSYTNCFLRACNAQRWPFVQVLMAGNRSLSAARPRAHDASGPATLPIEACLLGLHGRPRAVAQAGQLFRGETVADAGLIETIRGCGNMPEAGAMTMAALLSRPFTASHDDMLQIAYMAAGKGLAPGIMDVIGGAWKNRAMATPATDVAIRSAWNVLATIVTTTDGGRALAAWCEWMIGNGRVPKDGDGLTYAARELLARSLARQRRDRLVVPISDRMISPRVRA